MYIRSIADAHCSLACFVEITDCPTKKTVAPRVKFEYPQTFYAMIFNIFSLTLPHEGVCTGGTQPESSYVCMPSFMCHRCEFGVQKIIT